MCYTTRFLSRVLVFLFFYLANGCIILRLSRVGGATVYQADRVLHPVPLMLARVPEAATAMVEGDPSAGGGVWGNPLQSGGSQTQTHFPGFANLSVVRVLAETSPPMAQFPPNFASSSVEFDSSKFSKNSSLLPTKRKEQT